MSASESQILYLNLIELCVAVFRGPDSQTWTSIAEAGLPDLGLRVQKNSVINPAPVLAMADALAPHADSGDFTELETEYVRLFIAGANGVPAPLYESCHLGKEERTMGESALAMRDRLAAAGLEVSLPSNEPPDHLTIELEYLYALLAEGWSSDPTLAEKGTAFADEVMLSWVRAFRTALRNGHPHPVYGYAADVLVATLEGVVSA